MLKINGYEVKKDIASSREVLYLPHLEGQKVLYFEFKFEGNASLMDLYFTAKQLPAYDKVLVIDYIPYMGKGDGIAKSVADIINLLDFKKVYTLDPVSRYAQLFIKNLEIGYCPADWEEVINEEKADAICIYSKEDVDKYLDCLEQPPFNVLTVGEYLGNSNLEIFKDKTVLIVDSIFGVYDESKFFEMATTLKEKGAKKVVLYITHCTPAIHKGKLLEMGSPISKVYFSTEVGDVNNSGQSQNLVQFVKEYDF